MRRNDISLLIAIAILALVAIWLALPLGRPDWTRRLLFWRPQASREIKLHEGLDLQGGLQVLLQANMPEGEEVTRDAVLAAKGIIESRVNGLGVSEPLIQLQGADKIVVELPGISDPDAAIKTFGGTGLLEFIDAGDTFLPPDVLVATDFGQAKATEGISPTTTITNTAVTEEVVTRETPATEEVTATAELTATTGVSPTEGITTTAQISPTEELTTTIPATTTAETAPGEETPIYGQTYHTVMTGRDLSTATVGFDPTTNAPLVQFTLTSEGAKIFAEHTRNNVGKYLAIVLDKRVISSPVIQSAIPSGRGVIQGNFTLQSARNLVIQLKYGALPVPLEVMENRTVGPTLGQDSVRKSLLAGQIGLGAVVLFMLIYYRLPGLLANIALAIYSAIVFAIFKLIPVTLTLPGIAGFILSIGMAVDANILIFERMKEELRVGKVLGAAVEAGFNRAWPSIRDSNFSTLITCAILFWFGSFFGASVVKGFAMTLAIGVLVSMFTAIVVTRSFLRVTQHTFLSRGSESESRLRALFGY